MDLDCVLSRSLDMLDMGALILPDFSMFANELQEGIPIDVYVLAVSSELRNPYVAVIASSKFFKNWIVMRNVIYNGKTCV